jgi:lysyl-tRNA synthetase class 2
MNANTGLRFLRPCLSAEVPNFQRSAYVRFYNSTRCLSQAKRAEKDDLKTYSKAQRFPGSDLGAEKVQFAPRHEVEQRIVELEASRALEYPRIKNGSSETDIILSIREYVNDFKALCNERPLKTLTIRGTSQFF